MIWYILISLLIALLLWILIGPVSIIVNTEANRYYLVLPAVFRAELMPSEEPVRVKGWIFFVPYLVEPFRIKQKKKNKSAKQKTGKRSYGKMLKNTGLIKGMARSFRIRKLLLDIDTDDFILNALLVPAFSVVNQENIQLQTNFSGSISLMLEIRTRIGMILWSLIKYKSFH